MDRWAALSNGRFPVGEFSLTRLIVGLAGMQILVLTVVLLGTIRASQLGLVLVCAVSATVCWQASRSADDRRSAAAWRWMMLAMSFIGVFFVASAVHGEYIASGSGPLPLFAQFAVVLGYFSCVISLAYAIQVPRSMALRLLLDAGIAIVGTTVIAVWVLHRAGFVATGLSGVSTALYEPLLDLSLLVLVGVALMSMSRWERLFRALIWAAVALAVFFVGHVWVAVVLLGGGAVPVTALLALNSIGIALVAIAAGQFLAGKRMLPGPAHLVYRNPLMHSFWFHFGSALVPYVLAIAAASLLFAEAIGAGMESASSKLMLAGSVAFIMASGFRHAWNQIENRNLNRNLFRMNQDLENLVDRRTTELVRRNEELEVVHKIAMISTASLDLPATLRAVAEQLTEVVGASRCIILERTDDGVRIVARHDVGGSPSTGRLRQLPQTFLDFTPEHVEQVGFRSIVVKRWAQPNGSLAAQILDANESSVVLVVPLVANDQTVGIAELYRVNADPFDDSEVSLAESVATQAALATENARAFRQVRFAADHDPVTGLLNHRALHEALAKHFEHAVNTGNPMSVVMMDLNLFKEFNDRFGHQAGDSVLGEIARGIRASMPTTAVTARYGGDEFTVIVPDCSADRARIFVEAISEHVSRIQGQYGFVGEGFGIAAGIAAYPDDGFNLNALVALADERMYEDKWRLKGYPDRRRPRKAAREVAWEASLPVDLDL